MESKRNTGEGVPLNSNGMNTVIQLVEKPAEVNVHITSNTTVALPSLKKLRLCLKFSFLLSIISIVLSCSAAIYYWHEMTSLRKEIDVIKKNNIHSIKSDKTDREPKMYTSEAQKVISGRRYFVKDLGEDTMDVDSKTIDKEISFRPHNVSPSKNDQLIVHFYGDKSDLSQAREPIVGPWIRDLEISTPNSEEKIVLEKNYFIIQESGLYFIYAQLVYATKLPNYLLLLAHQPNKPSRQLSMCASGSDHTDRTANKSQISCSLHTLARLTKGDFVNLVQREINRTVLLKTGYSYIGFVKISS